MDFRPVGFALPYSCRFFSGLATDRVCSIVKGLRHTAGILRGHQVLHHVADGSAYCKFVFRDGEPLRSPVYHPALSQSKALFGSVHPREDAVILEILIGIHNGGGAAQTNQQGSHMPIVYNMEELRKVLTYDNINIVGVEAIAKTADSEMIDPENLKWIREQGLYIWVNSINLGRGHELSGTYNDDVALSEGPDAAWGVLMDRGYNVIQTDWPSLLASYRDERFGV